MSKWQSVTDILNLPPYNKKVLTWNEYHKQIIITHRTYTNAEGEHWDCNYDHHISHWAKLPEPPNQNLSLLPSQKSKGEKS